MRSAAVELEMADRMGKIPKFNAIEDAIADDQWSYVDSSGKDGDWLCPIEIDHRTDGVQPVFGAGPVDALMNAIEVVKAFADQVGRKTPRANEA